jgi:enamine deaminase RidA (YjgF/YER057c/UK114 family)
VQPDGKVVRGKVGTDLDLAAARDAARLVGLSLLATVRRELGTLDAVRRVVKVLGMVNCAPGFNQTPAVIDGCSDLLVEVFGDDIGRHARSAVGMAELPFDIPVEIEMIIEVQR